MNNINLDGEFVTHKVFGHGQIIDLSNEFVTVLFCDTNEKKKFIYPSAVETFLKLDNEGTAKEFKEFSLELAQNNEMAQRDAMDRLTAEKFAISEHAKMLKKALKKKTKTTKKSPEPLA